MRLLRSDRGRLVLICLMLNGSVLAGVAARNPAYLSDVRLNDSLDARHYVQLGRNLLLEGRYSRTESPPYPPDFLRTPIYPVVAGGLDILFGAAGIYALQIGLQVGVVLLVHWLASLYFGARAGFWAGLLPASDLMSAVYNFNALTEPLFVALTLCGVALVLPWIVPPPEAEARACRSGPMLAGGLLLALGTLTRPAGLYLPLILAGAALWRLARRGRLFGGLAAAALILVPSVVLVGAWGVRNQRQFGVARVSGVDAVGTVFMAGAGAYQLHHGVSRPEAQAMIVAEFDLPSLAEAQNPWSSDLSIREIDGRLRAAAPEILRRYPWDLAASSLLALLKGSLSHNLNELETLHARDWDAPGLGGLAKLEATSWRRLFGNHPLMIGAFFWQVAHALATLALALVGLVVCLRTRRHRQVAVVFLLVIAYFGAGMALFGVDAYYRSRIPLLPYLFILGGLGLERLLSRGQVWTT